MLFLWLVLGSRSRFRALDRWRCSRSQRFNGSGTQKDGLRTTVWSSSWGDCIASESARVSQGSAFWADHVAHHVRGIQLKPQALRCVKVAQAHVL